MKAGFVREARLPSRTFREENRIAMVTVTKYLLHEMSLVLGTHVTRHVPLRRFFEKAGRQFRLELGHRVSPNPSSGPILRAACEESRQVRRR